MSTPPNKSDASTASAPHTDATVEPIALRLLRAGCAIGLVLAITFLFGLALIGWVPLARAVFTPFVTNTDVYIVAVSLTVAFIVLAPITLFTLFFRHRRLTWGWLASGWVVVIPAFVWLAWDEPAIRRPLKIDEIAPAFDGAEKSHEVLMRYSTLAPGAEAKAFTQFKPAAPWTSTRPKDSEKWVEHITRNRTALEADWAALAPQRRWLDELNAFERIGDLSPARYDANSLRFDVWQTLTRNACAIASLQALDGQADAAIVTLLPYLEVSRKLEPSSHSLVRLMTARFVLRWSLETVNFVLDRQAISPDSRSRLGLALAGGNSGAGARRLILVEYPAFASVVAAVSIAERSLDDGPLRFLGPLAWLRRFVVNPVATVNRYGDFLYGLASLAETRQPARLAVRGYDFAHAFTHHDGPKNIGGGAILNLVTPSFEKLVRSYWEIEDLRVALHARVTTSPSARL